MEKFFIELPLTGEYLTTVRLTTGGLCALAGFDVDATEDYKVCVTESLLMLKRNGYARANVCFCVGETLGCTVQGIEKTTNAEESLEDEISRALLSALVGEVSFETDENDALVKISFEG